jgi:hypothetical protein
LCPLLPGFSLAYQGLSGGRGCLTLRIDIPVNLLFSAQPRRMLAENPTAAGAQK